MRAIEFIARLLRYVILASVASHAFAGTIDPNTPDEKYVEFGKQFPFVVRFKAESTDKPPREDGKLVFQYASAVIIRPHWALTAAHVVSQTKDQLLIKDGTIEFPISAVLAHADFKEENHGYCDIALCYSAKDFDLAFYCPLYTDKDELGKAVTIAGYGINGTFVTGGKASDGKRRAGHNKVDAVERAVMVCTPSRQGRFPLEFVITPGDSGGGLFIGNKLAGINSFLMATDKVPDGTYTDEGAHTRVSMYIDWIDNTIAQHEATLTATK